MTGLGEILRDPSAHVTLFAATDLAFETLAEKRGQTVEELLKEGKYLRDVSTATEAKYHQVGMTL